MSLVQSEEVLVIPTTLLHQLGYFQGFCPDIERYLGELLKPENTSYRRRGEMESDPNFKQLIPYVLFRYRDEQGQEAIFRYTRGKGQGEQRLHQKHSVGIGGHISSIDASESNPYEQGMRRELEEEVSINTRYEARCVGLINDDETEVGKVHLGVVHIFDVATPDIEPREDEIMNTGFIPVKELLEDLEGFESWSRICLSALFSPPEGQ